MNCHMPKINEGINSLVRTHTIFSPTNPAMIEANRPNACNLATPIARSIGPCNISASGIERHTRPRRSRLRILNETGL